MRKIEKRAEPQALTEWRSRNQAAPAGQGINFGYDLLRQSDTVDQVMNSLLSEQGYLCAYTGCRINDASAHIEHVTPQTHCVRGQDVAYTNMVACWPQPNLPKKAEYGAHQKDDWPSPAETTMFVSPLSNGCETRFKFSPRGEIVAADASDRAAIETIKKLKLGDGILTDFRRDAIDSVLGRTRNMKLEDARKRLRKLEEDEKALNSGANVKLNPYCFVLKQALQKHISRLGIIRKQKKSA